MPTKAGKILELAIETLYETTHVDGLALDLLVEGRAVKTSPLKRFGVLFADTKPEDEYPIPVLWVCDGLGTWLIATKAG
ncbi:MAG: hypothetical protein V7720_18460 [Halioglobus sp.]